MEVEEAIEKRRSLRALDRIQVEDERVEELIRAASLAPSCFNNQPWRFVVVRGEDALERLKDTLNRGNSWAKDASLIIAVLTREDLDCVVGTRRYYQFDVGMAVGMMMLRAEDMGLVAHAIAGFDEEAARSVLNVPEEMELVTLVIVGKKSENPEEKLSGSKLETEFKRPERLPLEEIYSEDVYSL